MNFLKKNFSLILLIISNLFLFYTIYRSEFFWNGNNRDFYLIYYLLSFIFIFFSILSFYISQKIKEYLIIILISSFTSIYLFEGYLTFNNHFLKEKAYWNKTGNKWDRRTLLQIYEDKKIHNNEIVVAVSPDSYLKKSNLIFPLSGISDSKTINCNENGYYSIYKSDRFGFNNPDLEWDKKDVEYLLIGDSFVHGACVNRPYDIGSVLRVLSKKPVISLGYGGNGPLIEYATLREYSRKNVKKILWFYYEGNDLESLQREKDNNILKNYLTDLSFTQNLKLRQKKIDNLAINYIIEKQKDVQRDMKRNNESFIFIFLKFIKIYNIRNLNFSSQSYTEKSKQFESIYEFQKILKLVKNLAIENNSKFYFVYLPAWSRYKHDYGSNNYYIIKEMLDKLEIPFIDIHEQVFDKEQNPLKLFPYELMGHYNINGYKKVSEKIYQLTKD